MSHGARRRDGRCTHHLRDRLRRRVVAGTSRQGGLPLRRRRTHRAHHTARERAGHPDAIRRKISWRVIVTPASVKRNGARARGNDCSRSPTTFRLRRSCRRCASRRHRDPSCWGTEPEGFHQLLHAEPNDRVRGARHTFSTALATCRQPRTQRPQDKGNGRRAPSTLRDRADLQIASAVRFRTATHARTTSGATAPRTTRNPSAQKSSMKVAISLTCSSARAALDSKFDGTH